jgi:hypothetical protein
VLIEEEWRKSGRISTTINECSSWFIIQGENMDAQSERVNTFLYELYRQVDNEEIPQVSMHSVGANLGLDKAEATALAEELMINDLVELKTLAGEITITPAGLEVLQEHGLVAEKTTKSCKLSGEVILTDGDQKIIQEFLTVVRLALAHGTPEYKQLEEAVIDIKTLEVQLLSPQPKTAIALAVFSSLKKSFQKNNHEHILAEFDTLFEGL